MSVRRLAEVQPASFEFTPENKAWAEKEIAKYPPGRQASAVIALLWRAQAQNDYWLPRAAIEKVADMLDMPHMRALEVATFYTMFNLEPVGKHHVQLCGTTPCMLRGAEEIKKVCKSKIGDERHVTADGKFSWIEVECLGACCNAPMVQINDDYYEDLTPENFAKLLDDLAAGRPVTKGSQTGRVSSEPEGGKLTALTTLYGVDGRGAPAPRRRRTMTRPRMSIPPSRPTPPPKRRMSRRSWRPCPRTPRPSRRPMRSARARRPLPRRARTRATTCSASRASARSTRSACTNSASTISTRSRPGRAKRFAGSGPICRFPDASTGNNGSARRPISRPAASA